MKRFTAVTRALSLIVLGILFTACEAVEVSNCEVVGYGSDGVKFEADVYNPSNSQLKELAIQVGTGSANLQTIGNANYTVGPIQPKQKRHVIAIARLHDLLIFSRENRMLPVRSCFVQAIRYQDGTSKVFYNPI